MQHEALPQGSLPMHGEGFNGVTPPEVVAQKTALFNQPTELERRFLGEDNPSTLLRAPISGGSEVRLHVATGPYTPYHYMMLVAGEDFQDQPKDQPIKAELLTDHPHETQKAYWELLLEGLEGYREVLGPDYRVFSGGNWMRKYSDFGERNARTIGLHHDHVMAVHKTFFKDYIDDGLQGIQGFDEERALTNRLLPHVLPRVQGMLGDASTLRLQPRTEMPYGYSFQIPGEADIDTFTTLMRNHHEAYAEVATTLAERYGRRGVDLLTQPSYNLYVEIDDKGDRHISVSPSFAGPVGVMESAGVQSKRALEYPHRVDPREAADTQRTVAEKVFANSSLPNLELPKQKVQI
jgi:hypothetical protein